LHAYGIIPPTPPTMEFEFGDIALVPFPFTDQRTSKRPGTGGLGVPISGWQEAGLVAPSTLKPVVATIEKTLVIKKPGRLPEADRTSLSGLLSDILGSA